VLRCPSDSADGGENGDYMPYNEARPITSAVTSALAENPELDDPTFVDDVIWFNISYLYIVGMTSQDGAAVGLMGDESNAADNGFRVSGLQNAYGTLRREAPQDAAKGYQQQDNHGITGGSWAFSDGHVEWISQGKSEYTAGERVEPGNGDRRWFASGTNPHDRIFQNIARNRKNGTGAIQTID
jgi:hypothetical protein